MGQMKVGCMDGRVDEQLDGRKGWLSRFLDGQMVWTKQTSTRFN